MRLAVVSMLTLALGVSTGAACTPSEDLCSYLDDALKRCDLPAPKAQCIDAEEATKAAVVARLKERGCEGLSADDKTDAVDPRVCALAGWSCPDSPTPAATDAVPANPILLVGGIDSSAVFDWHPRIAAALRGRGMTVQHVSVLPWATTAERAEDLWQSIAGWYAKYQTKMNLVCYAVGGIDCRYVASPNGLYAGDAKKRAAITKAIGSITTISTPHRGTRVAEAALSILKSGTTDDLIASLVGQDVQVPDNAALIATLEGLTPDAMAKLNKTLIDADGVVYQSWAGTSHVLGRSSKATDQAIAQYCADDAGNPLVFGRDGDVDAANPILLLTFPFGGTSLGEDGQVVASPTDGMVSVASAKWGTFRGCLPADHYDVIGQIGHTTRDPLTGFDAPAFYGWLASDLAARGL